MINFDFFELKNTHFDEVAEKVKKLYEKDPLNFLFIGPSGFYVKQVADRVAKKLNKTINRDGFRVINQYITEIFKVYNPTSIIIDRDFLKIYIEKEIEDLIEREKNDVEFSKYVNVLSKSTKSTEYILDIFEKKWEINKIEDKKALTYSNVYLNLENMETNTNFYKLYKKLEESLENILNKKFNDEINIGQNYDSISIYKWFYTNFKDKLGKNIVISGFFDISPVTSKVLEKLVDSFENSHIYAWEMLKDRSFESLKGFYKFMDDKIKVSKRKQILLKDVFKEKNISIYRTSDIVLEVEKISKDIKKKILVGIQPEEIGVVVSDAMTAKMFSDYFDEINVPHRFKDDNPLSQSRIVSILLQPLKTVVRGYEIEDMLAMIESGYCGKININIDEFEKYLKKLNLFYSSKSSLKKRKDEWNSAFEDEINKLKYSIKNTEESERVKRELETLNELLRVSEDLFKLLKEIEESSKNFNVSTYREFLKKWEEEEILEIKTLKKYENFEVINSEIIALKEFSKMLIKTERTLEKIIGDKKINISKFYRIINDLCEIEKFRSSEKYSNTIEIMNLSDSRFVNKKYKYFIDFTENNYPKVSINPFLTSMNIANESLKISEKMHRRSLFISMIFSENIIFSTPISTLDGEPILSSPYEKEFFKYFDIKEVKMYGEKKEVIPKDADEIFSELEKDMYYILQNKDFNLTKEVKNLKENIKNNKWKINEKTKIGTISHNKVSTYVDCPFRYYLSYIAKIRGDKDFNIFSEGLIKHAAMKTLFGEYPYYDHMDNLYLNREKLINELSNIIEEIWKEMITEGLEKYSAIKEVEIEKISEELYESIGEILKDYINMGKKLKLNYSDVLKTEYFEETNIKIGKYKLKAEARIDRIDKTNGNYIYLMDQFEDNLKPEAYSIIDYKNKASFQSEQLFLYYKVLENSKEFDLKNKDVYLKFQPLDGSGKMGDKFIKIQKDMFIIKKKGNSKQFLALDLKEYENWFEKILSNIEESNFDPISIKDREIKRFLEETSEKYGNRKTGEKYYECEYCQYLKLCSMLEYLKNFKVKKGWKK
ncbi:PD-(D/E)XK nuclease family protein [Tepiditoga spiralis]|nr:PD-(D/E)XK nuclease family protein [Tepiditoga spiralis]